MRVLITGAFGFLGKEILEIVKQREDIDIVSTCSRRFQKDLSFSGNHLYHEDYVDLSYDSSVERLMSAVNPDVIIHTAANPNTKPDPNDPNSIYNDNIVAVDNLLRHSREDCKFIFLSSVTVYGDYLFDGQKFSNLRYHESSFTKPTSVYATTKLAAENLISVYKKPSTILRLCATVGSGATHGVLPDFVKKLRSDDETFPVIGKFPGSIKPYLHVDDAVAAVNWFLTTGLTGTFNVCPNDEISIEEIAGIAQAVMGTSKEVVWKPELNWKGDNPVLRISNSKLLSTGFKLRYNTSAEAVQMALIELSGQK